MQRNTPELNGIVHRKPQGASDRPVTHLPGATAPLLGGVLESTADTGIDQGVREETLADKHGKPAIKDIRDIAGKLVGSRNLGEFDASPFSEETYIIPVADPGSGLSEIDAVLLKNIGWQDGEPYDDKLLQLASQMKQVGAGNRVTLMKPSDNVLRQVREYILQLGTASQETEEENDDFLNVKDPSIAEAVKLSRKFLRQTEQEFQTLAEETAPDTQVPVQESSERPSPVPSKNLTPEQARTKSYEEFEAEQNRRSQPTDEDRRAFINSVVSCDQPFEKAYTVCDGTVEVLFREMSRSDMMRIQTEIQGMSEETFADRSVKQMYASRFRLIATLSSVSVMNNGMWQQKWTNHDSLDDWLARSGLTTVKEAYEQFRKTIKSEMLVDLCMERYNRFSGLVVNLIEEYSSRDF